MSKAERRELIRKLGDRFSVEVRNSLTDAEFVEVVKRNFQRHPGEHWCATHDFCDANEVMGDAFKVVVGRESNPQDDDDLALWNAAWADADSGQFQSRIP